MKLNWSFIHTWTVTTCLVARPSSSGDGVLNDTILLVFVLAGSDDGWLSSATSAGDGELDHQDEILSAGDVELDNQLTISSDMFSCYQYDD